MQNHINRGGQKGYEARHKAHRFYRIWRFRQDQASLVDHHKFKAIFRKEIRFAKRHYHRKNLQSSFPTFTWALFDEQCHPNLPPTINDLVLQSGNIISNAKLKLIRVANLATDCPSTLKK